jgi:tetratricopeptide (TPR) repeat protein
MTEEVRGMTYQEEEKSKLRRQASREAIALAMQGQWREAITVNKKLTEIFPNDVEAYNRLGRAYLELGEYTEAEVAYRRSLEIDSYNGIAQKNLQRLSLLKKTTAAKKEDTHRVDPQYFIEEIGKAGVVQLHDLAPAVVLARVVAGDVVSLKINGNNLVVESNLGEYLGNVEAKHGQRLIRFMNGGNKYSAAIVKSEEKAMTVIIRETYHDPSLAGQLSFPTRGVEPTRTDITDRVIRRELEQEEALPGEQGYTVVGGDESEVLTEEPAEDDFDDDSEN